ncbi:p53 and DNA damage-regulated protein 1 [Geranomyces michiganensis]|nr:p53 and DNA damage-regulated protein 1 [Geranomyces michiganensis]
MQFLQGYFLLHAEVPSAVSHNLPLSVYPCTIDQAELERLAEDILIQKQLVIDLDRRRNDNRVALRSISAASAPHKTHFFAGGLFIKLPTPAVKSFLTTDQANIDAEIERLRTSMKKQSRELELLEKGAVKANRGFDLKGMRQEDLAAIAKRPSTQ